MKGRNVFFSIFGSNHLKQIQFSNLFHFLFQKKMAAIFYSRLTQNFIWWNFTTPGDSSIEGSWIYPPSNNSHKGEGLHIAMCYLKVLFFVILMVKVSQHPGKGFFSHLDIQYQYPPAGSSQPHGKQRETSRTAEIFCQLLSNNPVLKEVLPSWDLIWFSPPHNTGICFCLESLLDTNQHNHYLPKRKHPAKKSKEKPGRQRRNLGMQNLYEKKTYFRKAS